MNKEKAKKIIKVTVAFLVLHLVLTCIATKAVYDNVFKRYDEAVTIPEPLSYLAEERSEHFFFSGENRLSAYLYTTDSACDDLILIMPGLRSSTDDYLPLVKDFTDGGMDVFIFDPTGSCTSEGDSAGGFPKATEDLCAAIKYAEENLINYDDIFLFGHSRGGYAVCCSLEDNESISAAVSVNAPNSAMEGIVSPVENKVGILAYNNYPLLWLYQVMLFDAESVNKSAAAVIEGSDVPLLVIQAENDNVVSADRFSVFSHKDEVTRKDAEFSLVEAAGNIEGHSGILFCEDGANEELTDEIISFYKKHAN